jgi:glycerol transport system ATP-binding protein
VPATNGGARVQVESKVLIAEISGSESVVHFELDGRTWVSLSHGVHGFRVGDRARFALEVERALYFAPDGARVGG